MRLSLFNPLLVGSGEGHLIVLQFRLQLHFVYCSQSEIAVTDLIQALWKESQPTSESPEDLRHREWYGRRYHYQAQPESGLSSG